MALVLAADFASPMEGEIVRGRLEAEGVDSVLFDAELQGLGFPAPVRLMVDEDDLARARRILNDFPKR